MNIFITGISSGIGKALALNLAEQGYQIYGTSRSILDYKHSNIRHMQHDLNFTESNRFEILNDVENLDYVILNAGTLGTIATLKKSSMHDLQKLMETNLWGQKKVIDNLLLNHKVSRVYGISSGAAIKGSKGWGGYALSKAAFKMLIELYASEENDIQFLSIAPGLINTKMQDYICDEVSKQEFPNMQRLKDARDDGSMLTPTQLAAKMTKLLKDLDKIDSGSFLDLRNY